MRAVGLTSRGGSGRIGLIVLGLGVLAALAGCGTRTVQETLGVGKRAPDEFQVVRRAPLVLPPDYNLRPPQPGGTGPQGDVTTQAEEILTGRPPPRAAAQSPGEAALLAQSPVAAEPGIRAKILQENAELVDLDDRRFLFILDFQRRRLQPQEPVIDPVAEAQRLRSDGAAGSVVTQRTGSEPLPPASE
jgi:hypothetical protein